MKILAYLIAAIGFSSSFAGAYEDFFTAVRMDNPTVVRSLLSKGFDPNTPDPGGLHALYLALRAPSPNVAEALLDARGIKIDVRNAHDETPLMMGALRGQRALSERLIAKGADVNKPGWAPLHYAATSGDVPTVQLLLDHHAYIDAESPNGTTPLMMAAKYGSPEAVKHLLDAGADASLKNQLGFTALDFARQASRVDAEKMLSAVPRAQTMPTGASAAPGVPLTLPAAQAASLAKQPS